MFEHIAQASDSQRIALLNIIVSIILELHKMRVNNRQHPSQLYKQDWFDLFMAILNYNINITNNSDNNNNNEKNNKNANENENENNDRDFVDTVNHMLDEKSLAVIGLSHLCDMNCFYNKQQVIQCVQSIKNTLYQMQNVNPSLGMK